MKCGRCHGRGYIHRIRGVGHDECPACKGTGVKVQKSSLGSRTASVPLSPGARCIVCNAPAINHHHVISQSRIDRFVPDEHQRAAKEDIRNVTPLCHDCHSKVEAGSLELATHELHPDFAAFVAEYDLEAALPRHMTCGTVAQTSSAGRGTVGIRAARPSREVPR